MALELRPEDLHKYLIYEPETGRFFWKKRSPEFFNSDSGRPADQTCRQWNSRYAGKETFLSGPHGYRGSSINGEWCSAHRVAWAMTYGEWPDGEVDHIDHDPSNNRIENLRLTSRTGNMRNQKKHSTNTSGFRGVHYYEDRKNRWRARITVGGRQMSLGHFATKDEAIAARLDAERKYGFHKNHGAVA